MIQLKKMKKSEHGSTSLLNLRLMRICISNGFNYYMQYQTTGKRHLQKIQHSQNLSHLNHHLIKSNQIHFVDISLT